MPVASGPLATVLGVEAITIRGLSVERAGRTVLHDIDLVVPTGRIVALVGPNGAGKTTLVETITGAHEPAAGSVTVLGQSPWTNRSALAERWSYMPQTGGLPMGLTVDEAVALFADLNGHGVDAASLVDQVGLAADRRRRWRRLSGGQQQRLSLAIALTGGPDLLLLDEPTAALDGQGSRQVLELIAERRRAGSAIVLTSHRADEIEQLADTVVLLGAGVVRATGTVEELTTIDAIVVGLAEPIDPSPVAVALGREVRAVDGGLEVPGLTDQGAVPAVTAAVLDAGGNINGIRVGRRPLADVLAELT